jgi:hypothetical protein
MFKSFLSQFWFEQLILEFESCASFTLKATHLGPGHKMNMNLNPPVWGSTLEILPMLVYTIYLTLKLVQRYAASVHTWYQYWYQEQTSLHKATHIFIPSPTEQLKEVRKLWPKREQLSPTCGYAPCTFLSHTHLP